MAFNISADDLVGKIVAAVVISLLVGGSSPWWWNKLFPQTTTVAVALPPECSPEMLRVQLVRAGVDKAIVIKSSARTMRDEYRLQFFDCVYGLAGVLLQDDQDNGHGLYYAGEVWRERAKQDNAKADLAREQMRQHFFRYLSVEVNLPAGERNGDAAICYQREKGYCGERTAWVSHLMAVDYYQEGQKSTDRDIKLQRFQRALEFLKKDLQFGGFDQLIPSSVLKKKLEKELQDWESVKA